MVTKDGYIIAVEKTDANYLQIVDIISNKPTDPDGYAYKLSEDSLEWVLVELPPAPMEPITEDEALTKYANELTGEPDKTLQEATETLIKKVMEEK